MLWNELKSWILPQGCLYLGFIFFILVLDGVRGLQLPAINWDVSNSMFKVSNNDHIVPVQLNDEIDFVCPYHRDGSVGAEDKSYFIIMQVTFEEYRDCRIYNSDLVRNMIVNCSSPHHQKRFTILFEKYSPVPNGQEFREGDVKYYLTTSTGYMDGLMNRVGGACHSDNMKLTIKVCCDQTIDPYFPFPIGPFLGVEYHAQAYLDSLSHETGSGGERGSLVVNVRDRESVVLAPPFPTTTRRTTTEPPLFPTSHPRWTWSPPKTSLKPPDKEGENEVLAPPGAQGQMAGSFSTSLSYGTSLWSRPIKAFLWILFWYHVLHWIGLR